MDGGGRPAGRHPRQVFPASPIDLLLVATVTPAQPGLGHRVHHVPPEAQYGRLPGGAARSVGEVKIIVAHKPSL